MYHVTMGKCQALWNLVNRSPKASDTVSQISEGVAVLTPCPTRWNSMYDAVRRLVAFGDKLYVRRQHSTVKFASIPGRPESPDSLREIQHIAHVIGSS